MDFSLQFILFSNRFMTELSLAEQFRNKAGIRKMKKVNLRIDMTPMVDLGFLLISFFIFTTEISKPKVTNLYMPHDGDPIKIPDSKSLTILLDHDNKIFYYSGNTGDALKNNHVYKTSYDEMTGIGNIIRQKQIWLQRNNIDKKELIILIKPTKESSYKNLVNALDNMLVNNVTRYAIVNPEKSEEDFVTRAN